MMELDKTKAFIHKTFEVGIFLKGTDGFLEIIGGILLFFVNPALINKIVITLTQHELSEDPKDLIANYLINVSQQLSVSFLIFAGYYLLIHGVIKIFLIIFLWKQKLLAYPLAMIFFTIFIIYQIYRYTYEHSSWLVVLTIFDIFVVVLTWLEYRRLKNK